jgi:DNA-binding transcriptional ArsR family regulator
MESPKDSDLAEIHEKVEIVSTDDEKIKLIGSLLSNDASRNILKLLFEQDMTANEIAQKTGMLLSLVIFHLQKMQEAGLVRINKIGKNSKGHDMKYYGTTKLAVIIMPSKISDKAKKSKSLFNSLSRIYKFAAIGIAGLVSWLITKQSVIPNAEWNAGEELPNIPTDLYLPIIIGLCVIIIGMIIERVITKLKK